MASYTYERQLKSFAVYMMSNRLYGVLYTGVTSDLLGRVSQHRNGTLGGFTERYNCKRLVWWEAHESAEAAIAREKRLKRWRREWKLELIDELKQNFTIVIVTHSMQQAARVSQRTAFFHLGVLVEEGATDQIFTNPVDTRTRDYITGRFG